VNNWYEELVKECKTTHDKECEYGEECPERTSHIERVFVRHALNDRVVTLQARLAAVDKLHSPVEAIAANGNRITVCNHCVGDLAYVFDEQLNWPCPTIKAARGE